MGYSPWGRRDLDMTEQQLSVGMHRVHPYQILTLLPPVAISLFLLLNLANF